MLDTVLVYDIREMATAIYCDIDQFDLDDEQATTFHCQLFR